MCLSHCRSPLGQLLRYGAYTGRLRDLRIGLHHGAYCVGCCWALMLVLVAVGVMNVAVMAGIAAVIFVEKLWRFGPRFGQAVGVGFLVVAALLPSHPGLAPALNQPADMQMETWTWYERQSRVRRVAAERHDPVARANCQSPSQVRRTTSTLRAFSRIG